jgi:mono/diheme cytochrome c family protein
MAAGHFGGGSAPVFLGAWLAALAMLLAAVPVVAQDALRGKRLYLDTAREVGSGVSCVDCHGGLPGGLFGIGRAANDPAAVERAVNAIPQMIPLRGRLQARDYADLAAFLGSPAVPSPVLRTVASGPAATSGADRLDFGSVSPGAQSATSRWHLVNEGAVGLTIKSAPELRGDHPRDFAVAATDCAPDLLLASGASCSIDLLFRPVATSGARQAAVAVAHDWVGGEVAIALAGTLAAGSPALPPVAVSPSGGGGALPWIPWPVLAALLLPREGARVVRLFGNSGVRRQASCSPSPWRFIFSQSVLREMPSSAAAAPTRPSVLWSIAAR